MAHPTARGAARPTDPRLYQMLVLGSLLAYGILALDLEVYAGNAAAILTTAIAAQWLLTRLFRLPVFDPRSALISALSLCLLLRTDLWLLAGLGALLCIASKFLIRVGDKHVFNPTNFALAAMMLLTDQAWVSPGQWGSTVYFGFLLACLGGVVVYRAARSDVTAAFLAVYLATLFGRALWLGDPLSIPLHQTQNGALLIFAFFMISDPKTTPNARIARAIFGAVVALVAIYIQFELFQPNALIWALFGCAPLVPILDRVFPRQAYRWPGEPTRISANEKRRVKWPNVYSRS